MRKVLVRASLILFGLFLSAVVIEAALQIGALIVGSPADEIGAWKGSSRALRVLALGDSNTYGLHLMDRSQAYPTKVEELWRQRLPDRPIEIINAGVPGTNSSKLRNQLPALLKTFKPDVVTIMIGANDFWTEPEPIQPTEAEQREEPSSLWSSSRLYRLVYMIVRASQKQQVTIDFANPEGYRPNRGTVRYGEATFDLGWTRKASGSVPDWQAKLIDNCEVITQQARRAGVIPIFLTYAYQKGIYAGASETIRKATARSGAPLVDLRSVFQDQCPSGECSDLYYPTQHPTAKGHNWIAKSLLERLVVLTGDVESS